MEGNTQIIEANDDSKSRIKEYRKKVAIRPLETPKQYRSRVGRISRYRYLMSRGEEEARRARAKNVYNETKPQVGARHQKNLAEIKPNTPSTREKQIAYDRARGAYESRTFLEENLRMKGIIPAADIEDMKTQYQEWKNANGVGFTLVWRESKV